MRIQSQSHSVKIIAGKFRGRQLPVLEAEGLRPTSNRVRETLFNWLMNDMTDSRCLDLFAGTGALGLEALSRGASEVVFLENNLNIFKNLKEIFKVFKINSEAAKIYHQDALNFLNQEVPKPFDIIFCDPPFRKNLVLKVLALLKNKKYLHPNSLIYVECEPEMNLLAEIEKNFKIIRQKRTEQVVYSLLGCE